MSPPKPSIVALILALVYLVWPVDAIPDFFGPVGRLDDLAIFVLIAWQAFKHRKGTGRHSGPDQDSTPRSPHDVFGLSLSASQEEIDAKYRELVQQYHPDKVAHLGEDLQRLAHEKMLEITEAYRKLTGSNATD